MLEHDSFNGRMFYRRVENITVDMRLSAHVNGPDVTLMLYLSFTFKIMCHDDNKNNLS